MRYVVVEATAGAEVSEEIYSLTDVDTSLFTAVGERFGVQLFTLNNTFFTDRSEGFRINVPSTYITSQNMPLEIVIFYQGVPVITMRILEKTSSPIVQPPVVAPAGTHVGLTPPDDPIEGALWVTFV